MLTFNCSASQLRVWSSPESASSTSAWKLFMVRPPLIPHFFPHPPALLFSSPSPPPIPLPSPSDSSLVLPTYSLTHPSSPSLSLPPSLPLSLSSPLLTSPPLSSPLSDSFVVPRNAILNYNTQYSGITEETLRGVTVTLQDVQRHLCDIIDDQTVSK